MSKLVKFNHGLLKRFSQKVLETTFLQIMILKRAQEHIRLNLDVYAGLKVRIRGL